MPMHEQQLSTELEARKQQEVAAELQRLLAMGEEQRRVEAARRHIVDEILTLKCPRAGCRAAFLDFNGCFALTCGRCGCGFCAWCLADCGDDAHTHVAGCRSPRGTVTR